MVDFVLTQMVIHRWFRIPLRNPSPYCWVVDSGLTFKAPEWKFPGMTYGLVIVILGAQKRVATYALNPKGHSEALPRELI